MRVLILAFFSIFFLSSCGRSKNKSLSYSVKNVSSNIATLIILPGEKTVQMLTGICFKLTKEDFPISVSFGDSIEASYYINEPGHYNLENSKFSNNTKACISEAIK